MAVVEIAGLTDEVSKLGAFIATRLPFNLAIGASPRLVNEGRRERPRRTGDRKPRCGRLSGQPAQRSERRTVDDLTRHHLIGDASKLGDIGRDGNTGLP